MYLPDEISRLFRECKYNPRAFFLNALFGFIAIVVMCPLLWFFTGGPFSAQWVSAHPIEKMISYASAIGITIPSIIYFLSKDWFLRMPYLTWMFWVSLFASSAIGWLQLIS